MKKLRPAAGFLLLWAAAFSGGCGGGGVEDHAGPGDADIAAGSAAVDASNDPAVDAAPGPSVGPRPRERVVLPGPWPGVTRTGSVDARGGLVRFDDLILDVPEGAFGGPTTLRVSALEETPPPGAGAYSPIFRIVASGARPPRGEIRAFLPYFGPTGQGAGDVLQAYGMRSDGRTPVVGLSGSFVDGTIAISFTPPLDVFIGPKCAQFDACPCSVDVDCAPWAGPDKCKPAYICSSATHTCVPSPASLVQCPAFEDSQCTKVVCLPETGECVKAEIPAPCDDGALCTDPDVCEAGVCVGGPKVCDCQTNADCGDNGDLCDGISYCDTSSFPFTCLLNPAKVVNCAKLEPSVQCKAIECNPGTGVCEAVNLPDGTSCDGGPCHVAACQAGECLEDPALLPACDCETHAQCAAKEDGNLCNGTLFCNLATNQCQLIPATVVTCPTVDDTVCTQNVCEPSTGQCVSKAAPDGTKGDDSNFCTEGDACLGGVLKGGLYVCDCENDAQCAAKEDGNLCNGTLYCNKSKGQCVLNPTTIVECPKWWVGKKVCQKNTCDPATGQCNISSANAGGECDDGDACTDAACAGGACLAAIDHCECKADADCAAFEDGNACNGTLYCNKPAGLCVTNPATIIECQTGLDGPCEKNVCVPASGVCKKMAILEGQPCPGATPCVPKTCAQGQCVEQPSLCDCLNKADCTAQGDADKCDGTPYCSSFEFPWTCQQNPADAPYCSTTSQCQVGLCQPADGTCVINLAPQGNICTQNNGWGGMCTGNGVCNPFN